MSYNGNIIAFNPSTKLTVPAISGTNHLAPVAMIGVAPSVKHLRIIPYFGVEPYDLTIQSLVILHLLVEALPDPHPKVARILHDLRSRLALLVREITEEEADGESVLEILELAKGLLGKFKGEPNDLVRRLAILLTDLGNQMENSISRVARQVSQSLVKVAHQNYSNLVELLSLVRELESNPYLEPTVNDIVGKLSHQVLVLANRIWEQGIPAWEMGQTLKEIGSTLSELMVQEPGAGAELIPQIQEKLQSIVPASSEKVKQ